MSKVENNIYKSDRGYILAYFGDKPPKGMKYIVVELDPHKWRILYEIDSDGVVSKSDLSDHTDIGYLDDKWNPKDLQLFVDSHENEYWIPDLSLELLVGRWCIEVEDYV